MLPKNYRVDKKQVGRVFQVGKFINSSSLSFKFILNKDSNARRISFIAPKSVAKLAVERNTLRRLGYNALKKDITKFPAGLVGVFIFKKFSKDVSLIEKEIENILHKIN
ncbi:MAG: ribonuclease P protein component [bacterium]|nr:ribonuclease P protein component [bacterium]